MLWVIASLIVTVIAVFAVINGVGLRKQGRTAEGTMWLTGALVGWLVIVCGWGATKMFHEIPAGHVGVVYQFGGITGQVADGFQTTAPWQSIREASIQIQRATYELGQGNAAFSQESQDVFASATINYEV